VNAQLKLSPIEARCIERPAYQNENVRHVCLWVRDNHDALHAYYSALGKALADEGDDNLTGFAKAQAFAAWAQCQHDIASGRFW
jgi:hypothetical protein